MRNAFHQAAIACEHPGEVIDDRVTVAIEFRGQQFFRKRHTHGIGEPLAQRAGGGFDARGDAHLGMTRCTRMKLTEIAQLADREIVAGEMEERIEQHGAVPVREHKAVTVGPARVGGVVREHARPQRHRNFSHAHRHARVARVGLLHSIHGERTDRCGHARRQRPGGDSGWCCSDWIARFAHAEDSPDSSLAADAVDRRRLTAGENPKF